MLISLKGCGLHTAIAKAVDVLVKGGIIAYPTETLYGLGVRVMDKESVQRLFEIKGRPQDKPIPLIVGSLEVLKTIAEEIPPEAEKLIKEFWPGPLTLVFKAKASVSELLTAGTGTIAVRIPGESFALSLSRKIDFPITSTSANPSGATPPEVADEVSRYFGDKIDLIIDGGKTPIGKPSTIIDVTVKPWQILREGAITFDLK
ncbi:MAG TPA: threonylcarbamoyl-AMP synthase [Nitrospiraceae bacterium]|nr:threonylcarbamoyl-AMP synthase [Nitrospiraceae bacterium]